MLSIESHRLFVMHDFANSQPGDHFHEWPQHLTFTPLFAPRKGVCRDEVIDHITGVVSLVSPFYIEPGEEVLYGPNNNQPAIEILDQTGKLREIHTALIEELGKIGCCFDSLDFSLERYSPHVSKKQTDLLTDQPYLVSTITIAEKLPKSFYMPKKILKKIDL